SPQTRHSSIWPNQRLKSASGRPRTARHRRRHASAAGDDWGPPKNSAWTIGLVQKTVDHWARPKDSAWTIGLVQKTVLDLARTTISDAKRPIVHPRELGTMRQWPVILAVSALVAGGATPASALLFNLTSDHCTGGCGPAGTIFG